MNTDGSYNNYNIMMAVEEDDFLDMPCSRRSTQGQGPLETGRKGEEVLPGSLENLDYLDRNYSSPLKSPRTAIKTRAGFLDHAGSIGEVISSVIASSKRQPQRDHSPLIKEVPKEADIREHENLLVGLRNHAARRLLSEKAIIRWYEAISQFNQAGKTMGDYQYWRDNMAGVFTQTVNFKVSEDWDGCLKSFDISFPMICGIWAALARSGQISLEMKPCKVRAEVLSNGNIIIEDPECGYVGRWSDGSNLDRKVYVKTWLDLNLMIKWMEVRFIGRLPSPNVFSLEKLLDTSICNGERLARLERLVTLANMLGNASKSNGEPSDSAASNNKLQPHVKAFTSFSDAGKHERIKKALQMADTMCGLTDLLVYQKKNKIASPLQAFDQYASDYSKLHSPDLPARRMPVVGSRPTTPAHSKSFEKPIKKEQKPGVKRRKVTKRGTSYSSFRSHKEEGRGSNAIPGTNKIKF